MLTTFWPSRISIQHFPTDSSLFYFSFFSMDKVKLVKLGNLVLLLPTHPSLLLLHFIGLACFFHLLDNSLMIFPTHSLFFQLMRSLIDLVSALATYGGLLYFGKWTFWDLWVVSIQFNFPMRDVLLMYTIIHHYSMEGCTPIFISSFMWFMCMLVTILSSKIYFMCFFLESLLIAIIYDLYKSEWGVPY